MKFNIPIIFISIGFITGAITSDNKSIKVLLASTSVENIVTSPTSY